MTDLDLASMKAFAQEGLRDYARYKEDHFISFLGSEYMTPYVCDVCGENEVESCQVNDAISGIPNLANNVLTLVAELEKARERTAGVGCLCVEGADGRCVCR